MCQLMSPITVIVIMRLFILQQGIPSFPVLVYYSPSQLDCLYSMAIAMIWTPKAFGHGADQNHPPYVGLKRKEKSLGFSTSEKNCSLVMHSQQRLDAILLASDCQKWSRSEVLQLYLLKHFLNVCLKVSSVLYILYQLHEFL